MAFLDHIDPGNSGGSVPIPDTSYRATFKPVIYPCAMCKLTFKDQSSLSEHLADKHPIKRPRLLINGESLRKDNMTVRSVIKPEDISCPDVDEIYVNEEKIGSQEELVALMCSPNSISFKLRLVNQGYPVEYRWNIDIAKVEELERVRLLFLSPLRWMEKLVENYVMPYYKQESTLFSLFMNH